MRFTCVVALAACSFHCLVTFHCMNIPQFIYPFCYWWISAFFSLGPLFHWIFDFNYYFFLSPDIPFRTCSNISRQVVFDSLLLLTPIFLFLFCFTLNMWGHCCWLYSWCFVSSYVLWFLIRSSCSLGLSLWKFFRAWTACGVLQRSVFLPARSALN